VGGHTQEVCSPDEIQRLLLVEWGIGEMSLIFMFVIYNLLMLSPILATKLNIPPSRPNYIQRSHLIEQLNEGLYRKLSLISAPAGFGKTTLVSEWAASCRRPTAWLSLDEGDNDLSRFLTYLISALQTISANVGEGLLNVLQSPQPPSTESILTTLINEITTALDSCILVLDDYHVIESKAVDNALTFLLEYAPSEMHIVVTTREDPLFNLSRYRVRDELTELRANDLRFNPVEATDFLNRVMGLNLTEEDISILETRTEGWIAGLQLAALSMQGQDSSSFIQSFSGSHFYVIDYLIEEVLNQQSESVQSFLLRTSILDRLCGALCEAVLLDRSASGQETLEYLERANMFLIPLDNERRWYRYHHLFVEFLRQRLQHQDPENIAQYQIRASEWHEKYGLEIDAFQYAVAANDIERADRLVEGDGIPMHFRGAGTDVLNWLTSLPEAELDARPSLWVIYASTLLFVGQHTAVEQKLQAAEVALQDARSNDKAKDLVGRIASMRATLAVIQNDVETIIAEALRAQENLHPDNLIYRISATFALGTAYMFQGNKTAASQAFAEIISNGENSIYAIAATINLGQIQETNNQLNLAAKTYESGLHLAGDPPPPITCEGFLGLARIHYEWNDLDTAEQYGQQCFQMTQQMENVDSFASYGVFLSRLMLARGDVPSAVTVLEEAEEFVHQNNFEFRMPNVATAQVLTLLRGGDLEKAAQLAETHDLPLSKARVHLAEGNSSGALALLEKLRQQAKDLPDEQLKVMVLQAVAYQAQDELVKALQVLQDALKLAEPNGFVRIFVDEGPAMGQLLSEATAQGIKVDYVSKILAAFETKKQRPDLPPNQGLVEPLSKRELEILALIATGLKNKEIAEQLFISLNTVLYHIKNIYNKLGVKKRTLAIIKARDLNLLPEE
jgi:LuxR family maltose regulon positive regulatory protein